MRVYERDGYPVEGVDRPAEWLYPSRLLTAWTAVFNGQPVGHIAATSAAATDDIMKAWRQFSNSDATRLMIPVRLFVDPPHRKRGAGNLLMSATAEFATRNNFSIAFDVMAKDEQAIRLYERAGCQKIAEIVHEHSGGAREPAYIYTVPQTFGESHEPDTRRR